MVLVPLQAFSILSMGGIRHQLDPRLARILLMAYLDQALPEALGVQEVIVIAL
jgi:hypothetical protein